jgi:hypothetical protein
MGEHFLERNAARFAMKRVKSHKQAVFAKNRLEAQSPEQPAQRDLDKNQQRAEEEKTNIGKRFIAKGSSENNLLKNDINNAGGNAQRRDENERPEPGLMESLFLAKIDIGFEVHG